jgi:hypothetical protein
MVPVLVGVSKETKKEPNIPPAKLQVVADGKSILV